MAEHAEEPPHAMGQGRDSGVVEGPQRLHGDAAGKDLHDQAPKDRADVHDQDQDDQDEVGQPSGPGPADPEAGDHGQDSGSAAGSAPKLQICFDFTKGMCTRGDKCRYSHDLATIVHFNSKEKGVCFDYLRNQCHRGLMCRFSHDLSSITQQCQVFNGTATKGHTNAICYDFVKGVCTRGNDCRYSHDLSLIARTARGGASCTREVVCYDFLRGRCSRGTSCKYSHSFSFLPGPGPGYLSTGGSSDASGQTDVDSLSGATQAMLASAFGAYPPNMQLHQLGNALADGGPNPNRNEGLAGRLGQPPMNWPAAASQPAMVAAGQAQAVYGCLAQQQISAAAAAVANFNSYAQHLQQAAAAAKGHMGPPPPPPARTAQQSLVAARSLAQAEAGAGAALFMQSAAAAAAAAQLLRPSSSAPDELLGPGRQQMTPDTLSMLLSSLSTEDSAQLAESLKGWSALPPRPQASGHRMSESGVRPSTGPTPQQTSRRSVDIVPSARENQLSRLGPDRAMEMPSRTALSGNVNPTFPPTLMAALKEIWDK